LLQVNDFACVKQTIATNDSTWTPEGRNKEELVALAKIVLREPKNYMTFDDYAGQHAKEVVFPSPVDLSRLRVRVLDPYGEVVDMCSAQFSFSLEVLEIRNPLVYNAVRDSLAASVCGGAVATGGGADPKFLTAFGFTHDTVFDLMRLLYDFDGFIAGGAALYWFLGLDPPADQDLDIWIPSRFRRGTDDEHRPVALITRPDGRPDLACYAYDRMVVDQMAALLAREGFGQDVTTARTRRGQECMGVPIDIPYHRNPEFQRVVKVIHDYRGGLPVPGSQIVASTKANGRKIQVIYYYGDTRPLDGFDLDVCKISVVPTAKGEMVFRLPEGLDEAEVRARRMRVTNTSCRSNLFRRLMKYYTRRFVLVTADGRELTREEMVGMYKDVE
jgi:hypothetical protein